jgi:hypothetical protein
LSSQPIGTLHLDPGPASGAAVEVVGAVGDVCDRSGELNARCAVAVGAAAEGVPAGPQLAITVMKTIAPKRSATRISYSP